MERAVFRFIHDAKAQETAFRLGAIDLFSTRRRQDVGHFQGDSRHQAPVGLVRARAWWLSTTGARPERCARALRHHRTPSTARSLYPQVETSGVAIGSHFAPTDPGLCAPVGVYPYSPNVSPRLPKEAGVALLPLRLIADAAAHAHAREGGLLIAADLAKVGIEPRLKW